MTEKTQAASGEVVKPTRFLSADDYAGITSFDDALQLVQDKLGGEAVLASDLGDGFSVVDNKNALIGVMFIVLEVGFHTGDIKKDDGTYGEFASLRIVTKDGRKLVINDGGTGIPEQIRALWKHKPETIGKPIMVPKGLRVSKYDHPQYGSSETFYLDTSAQ